MKDLLEEYQDFLKLKNKEESTIRMYVQEVKRFMTWLISKKKELNQLEQVDVILYRDWLIVKGMKAATVNKELSTLKSFIKWGNENRHIRISFPENIRVQDEQKTIQTKWLSDENVGQLLQLAATEKNPFKKSRNEALIYVMLYGGLRVEEVSQLHLDSLLTNTILVIDDGNLSREVPIDSITRKKIVEWLEYRSKVNKEMYKDSPFLFVTERTGKMQPRSIQFVVEGYSEKLGFAVTSQLLRNTYCRRLVEHGYTVEQLKKYAGHKSIVTSYKYF